MNLLTELLQRPPVTLWDVIDILIVSVVVYEVLKLIRGTHAVQMAMGIASLVGLFYLSRGLQLETLNWLIRNVVGYVVFAAIVLMQADIRRALVHLGRAPVVPALRSQVADDDTVEELVVAATTLAAKKIGAIIVIERSIGLRNYIESGIPLDATLTYDLLVSIFQPTSPLHDGAVIVQGDRVAAAACFLPLTVNPRLEPRARLAASRRHRRHRRERRGRDRRVGGDRRHLAGRRRRPRAGHRPRQLRARLESLVTLRRARGKPRPGRVLVQLMAYHPFRNIWLKFLSICIAALLWLVVAGDRVVERAMRVPVEFQNLPAGPRARRRPARHGRRPAARLVRHAEPHGAPATCRP